MTVEIACRPAEATEIPKTAQRLIGLAESHGWDVATTYARGLWPSRNPKIVDNIAVRMWREGKLVGIWHDGKFYRGLSRSRTYTLAELRTLVAVTR
jgi:hypothetical protein